MWQKKRQSAEASRVLVRHADAGVRSEWQGSDEWRGLTDLGHSQARAIAEMLRDLPILGIYSSASLRCRQTVVPLALVHGLDVEPSCALGPQADPEAVLGLLADPATESSVLCTHRETLQSLFARLPGGCPANAAGPMEMAAAWILTGSVTDPERARLRYVGSGAAWLQQRAAAV